ncbi:putative MFS transporter [Pullulanibacillus pueri]|uniref:MFS transporter n=1 Tax=Pullulanibacillus pueri TaxID=1437324 RepID=A0A8J2ZVP8_9BACL|nr:MFS transporter [Pullulanibacillus pueri]MBM7680943.1 putative MFS transporter [Pullulanibacillus pueri]GGH81426.1 MFS transporter [Pullulanibacillus pueri]
MSFESFDAPVDAKKLKQFQRKVSFVSAGGTFLDGFDLTIIAVAMPLILKQWHVSAGEQSVIVAAAIIGSLIGASWLGNLTDTFGRKAMYIIDLVAFVLFAALSAFSQNVVELILFRFLLGVGIGADYPISATLVSEFSSTKTRGKSGTFLGMMWFVGAVVAYITGIVLLQLGDNAWRYMILVGAIFAIIIFIFRLGLPESPRWLVSKGREKEAEAIMLSLTGRKTVLTAQTEKKVRLRMLFSHQLLKRTFFVCGFWFCYAIAYYGISMYTPTLLSAFTEGSLNQTYVASAIVSVLGLIGALIGTQLVDIWGRRPLIITSFAGLTLGLLILAIMPHPTVAFLVILFSAAVLFANMGGGILNFVYPTELFPTSIRAGAAGFATSISRIGSILGTLVFPNFVAWWGNSAALWFFTAIGLCGLLISVSLALETKGARLEDLNQ